MGADTKRRESFRPTEKTVGLVGSGAGSMGEPHKRGNFFLREAPWSAPSRSALDARGRRHLTATSAAAHSPALSGWL